MPIRYVNQGYPRDELAGFYRAAEVGLVTPLRDGMNLVAKEYVAAQDPDDPGVLILSRFAGAALQMKDALLVNPYSKDEISDAIRKALDMPQGGADPALAGADRQCPARGRPRLAARPSSRRWREIRSGRRRSRSRRRFPQTPPRVLTLIVIASEARQSSETLRSTGLPRRFAPRNDEE